MINLLQKYKSRVNNLDTLIQFLPSPTPTKIENETIIAVSTSSYIEDIIDSPLDYWSYKTDKENVLNTEQITLLNALHQAYNFAQNNYLTKSNFFEAHKILAANLDDEDRGSLRKYTMTISDYQMRIIYIAPPKEILYQVFTDFWQEVEEKLKVLSDLTEIFFWASMFHLRLELIHPFINGNGRIGRLLEKWFLSQFLEQKAWVVPSEFFYAYHLQLYYSAIREVSGNSYEKWDYSKALNFLLLLPSSLTCKI